MRTVFGRLVALALALAASAALAQTNPPVRLRGVIEKVDGQNLTVKSREGATVQLRLADNFRAVTVKKISFSDIKQGNYVGTATLIQPDGSHKARHVHIFLDTQRGLAEGHMAWDVVPNSWMTNATVTDIKAGAGGGGTLTLKYKDGEKTITVPPDVPIVAYEPGSKDDVRVGAPLFVGAAQRQPDGSLQAAGITLGKNDVAPPM